MLKKDLILENDRLADTVGDLRSELRDRKDRLKKLEDESLSMKNQLACRDIAVSIIENRLVSKYPEPCREEQYTNQYSLASKPEETTPVFPEEYHWLRDVIDRLRYQEPSVSGITGRW